MKHLLNISVLAVLSVSTFAQKKDAKTASSGTDKPVFLKEDTYGVLNFRSIGPAVTSGRIIDIAVNPANKNEWFIAAAAGGVWKTSNAGVSFTPVFDNEGAYSIGCLAIDPNNPNVVWVGSGENNNQRSVGYGDGVYKSEDGGKSFKNMGLPKSEHIGKIVIDPQNGDIVYIAAYGPVWSSGDDRGIYKTTDGGKTWKQILTVSDHTGFNEIHIDPKHPSILYACAHQRRRHEWTYISGGPESAIYKSTDAGATWQKLSKGLPSGDIGRISVAVSPVNTDVLYAITEGRDNKGIYKSTDRGASWTKQSGYGTDGNYYQEIFADPTDVNRLYVMNTIAQVSNDGGKTVKELGEKNKHVDNHAIYVFPDNTQHILIGCDGGLYESFDGAATWKFFGNLPITQFYRVCTDNAKPFYNVYGGTQDNNTLGGPSRTKSASGITNADWFVTVGGDGFQSRVDPKEPNIVYSEWQYGGLIRFDRNTGELVDIKPMEKEGEAAYRFNWDAPLTISNFDNKRLYFAANKIFRSNDRGNSWTVISPDLSRGIDRNKLKVMDKVWSMDAIAKNASTSIFGNITAFCESPKNENLLFAGTDDGLIQVTENGGNSWTKISTFPGVPVITNNGQSFGPLVHYLTASQHNENTAYAVFNNHRNGDFKPYIMKSSDKGKTWVAITGDLPERGSAYCIAEDHINPDLLFCGTEYGIYFTLNGGKNWIELSSGLPKSVCIRDIAIQKEENDLVIATFGRGLYILDDYSLLQNVNNDLFSRTAYIFPVKEALLFNLWTPYGHKGKSFQGESFFTSNNPEQGAKIRLYLKESYKTQKEKRKENEADKTKKNLDVFYPTADSIRLEDEDKAPLLYALITDSQGEPVTRLKVANTKGIQQIVWDGRHELTTPVDFNQPDAEDPYYSPDLGHMALPGTYYVQVIKSYRGQTEMLGDKQSITIKPLSHSTLPLQDLKMEQTFNKELAEFRRVVLGTNNYFDHLKTRIKYLRAAFENSGKNNAEELTELFTLEKRVQKINQELYGDNSMARREFETLSGFIGSLETIVYGSWGQSMGSTGTYREKYNTLKKQFKSIYTEITGIKSSVETLESKAENMKLPATYGRLPKLND
ncbi:MAG: hypothetical protein QM534_01855 [Sediminibacterium sp.]|nr:hypothetical protein [Sediminibacterium sp.]